MDNHNIAAVFTRVAKLLAIQGDSDFKVNAYERAAESIRIAPGNVAEMDIEQLKELPAIGQIIAEKIRELVETGNLTFLQRLEDAIPVSLLDWLEIPGVGAKTTALIWKTLNITTMQELKAAAQDGKLLPIPGIGQKMVDKILSGIDSLN